MEDNTMKFLAHEGMVKVTCVNTKEMIQNAIDIHKLSKTSAKVFGDVLTIGAILGADLKDDSDNITLQVRGNGPIGQVVCVTKKGAKVKGYVQNPSIELAPTEDGKVNSKAAIGNEGIVYIIKDMGLKEPYIGVTQIVNGDIVNSFVEYYAKSEQIPTVLSTGMLFDENNDVKVCGGYIIQLMPDATNEVIDKIENVVKNAPSISYMLENDYDLVKIAKTITGDEEIMMMLGEIKNEYSCDCSRQRMEKGLVSLGEEELKQIIEEGKSINTKCHFCNTDYEFTIEQLQKLIYDI